MIITIDGPAGSGKSTIAEEVAKKLKFIHFNSGSLYRAIAAYAIVHNLTVEYLNANVDKITLNVKFKGKTQYVYVNDEDMTARLRDNEVSILSPTVSINPAIRKIVDNCQRSFATKHNLVVDGRDIGSFVFPNAEFKFYLDCEIMERARRRFKEEKEKNPSITLEEIARQIEIRDEIDRNKKIAPLVIPKGAIIIDSTNMTITDEVDAIISHVENNK